MLDIFFRAIITLKQYTQHRIYTVQVVWVDFLQFFYFIRFGTIPRFKCLGMRNLQYWIRICQKSHNTVTNHNYILCVVRIFMNQTLHKWNKYIFNFPWHFHAGFESRIWSSFVCTQCRIHSSMVCTNWGVSKWRCSRKAWRPSWGPASRRGNSFIQPPSKP